MLSYWHKRQDVFRAIQLASWQQGTSRLVTLQRHCETRWGSWLASVRDLRTTLSVVAALEEIDESDSSSRGSDAFQLLTAIRIFKFIFCLEFLFRLFSVTDRFSNDLQSPSIVIASAKCKAQLVADAIQAQRGQDVQ